MAKRPCPFKRLTQPATSPRPAIAAARSSRATVARYDGEVHPHGVRTSNGDAHGKRQRPQQPANRRSEWYWHLREAASLSRLEFPAFGDGLGFKCQPHRSIDEYRCYGATDFKGPHGRRLFPDQYLQEQCAAGCELQLHSRIHADNRRAAVRQSRDMGSRSWQPARGPVAGSGNGSNSFPTKLNFGDEQVGSTSGPQDVKLMNTGSTALHFASIVATGDFTLRLTGCGTSSLRAAPARSALLLLRRRRGSEPALSRSVTATWVPARRRSR